MIAGWALAQRPLLLKGLTVQQTAAPHETLVLVVIAVLAGATILFPSLALLFRLVLARPPRLWRPSRRRALAQRSAPWRCWRASARRSPASRTDLFARAAGAALLAGFGFLTVAEAGWAHAIGIVALFGFIDLRLSRSRARLSSATFAARGAHRAPASAE